jgi:hypothetical protein
MQTETLDSNKNIFFAIFEHIDDGLNKTWKDIVTRNFEKNAPRDQDQESITQNIYALGKNKTVSLEA